MILRGSGWGRRGLSTSPRSPCRSPTPAPMRRRKKPANRVTSKSASRNTASDGTARPSPAVMRVSLTTPFTRGNEVIWKPNEPTNPFSVSFLMCSSMPSMLNPPGVDSRPPIRDTENVGRGPGTSVMPPNVSDESTPGSRYRVMSPRRVNGPGRGPVSSPGAKPISSPRRSTRMISANGNDFGGQVIRTFASPVASPAGRDLRTRPSLRQTVAPARPCPTGRGRT